MSKVAGEAPASCGRGSHEGFGRAGLSTARLLLLADVGLLAVMAVGMPFIAGLVL